MDNLSSRTIKGIKWNFFNSVSLLIMRFVVGVVLARLIEPKEFGLMALAIIFTGFLQIFSTMGMGSAIIQKKIINDNYIKIAFSISLISGITLCIILFLLAPLVGDFFNEYKLTLIIRVLSFVFILNSITSIGQGLLAKELRFKRLFFIDLSSYFLGYSLISITLALFGFKVWSLVWGTLGSGLIQFVLVLVFVKFPKRIVLKRKQIKELLFFGGGISIANMLTYFSNHIDNLIVGKFLNPASLGLYNRAFGLMR